MGLSQGSSSSLKIADFGMVSESMRLIIVVSNEAQYYSVQLKVTTRGISSDSTHRVIE